MPISGPSTLAQPRTTQPPKLSTASLRIIFAPFLFFQQLKVVSDDSDKFLQDSVQIDPWDLQKKELLRCEALRSWERRQYGLKASLLSLARPLLGGPCLQRPPIRLGPRQRRRREVRLRSRLGKILIFEIAKCKPWTLKQKYKLRNGSQPIKFQLNISKVANLGAPSQQSNFQSLTLCFKNKKELRHVVKWNL